MLDDDQIIWFLLFVVFIIFSGIDSSMSMIESLVLNIVDITNYLRLAVVTAIGIMGITISVPFSTNFGWVLFDLVGHYIESYIIIVICIL